MIPTLRCLLFVIVALLSCCSSAPLAQAEEPALPASSLPEKGKLVDGKPVGEGWTRLLGGNDFTGWKYEPEFWTLKDGVLHGMSKGGPTHHYLYSEQEYANFEMHALVKLAGKGANSGVCMRTKPTNFDNVPGYQVDMGEGYWGCLWDERRDGMVVKFDPKLAEKLVKKDDWNHYYVVVQGPHIQIWLNGVKTVDVEHPKGLPSGSLAVQLCHGDKETIVDVKDWYIREAK